MRFSLRHMQIFAEIARRGSISAAAETLALSQSAASTALIELERRYDRPLFDRAGKRVRLNETGRDLLPAALKILDQASEIDALLTGTHGPGPVRIGATQTIGNYIAPALIQNCGESHPGGRLSLEIGNTEQIARAVADYSIDLGLLEGEYDHPDIVATEWLTDELVLICNPAHRLAARRTCTLDDVLNERWVVRERGSGTRQVLDRAIREQWTRLDIGMELQQIEAIVNMVGVSAMIGCVSRLAVRDHLARGDLVELRVPGMDLARRFYIVLNRAKYRTSGINAFLETCGRFPFSSAGPAPAPALS